MQHEQHTQRVLDGRYRVRQVIGRGEAADVYLGDDLFLGRAVTIKIPHDSVVSNASQLEQFRREAISLAGIRSPNVVSIYDLGLNTEGAYVVMQHIEGRTVEEQIRRFGPMPEARAAVVLDQLLAGLTAMHAKALVHGDIRSSNVLLARNGKVVLLDLGIVLDSRRAGSSVVGSGIPGDSRTLARPAFTCDVYQVGLLVLFILTGVDAARRSPRSGFEDLFRRLPLPFVALARRALDTDWAARFSSAATMKAAVEAALELEPKHEGQAVPRERDAPTTTMTAGQLLSLMADGIPTFDRVPCSGLGDDDETPKP